jgi:hypothetical protein
MAVTVDGILGCALLHKHKASDVTIADAGNLYASTTVEAALQEIGGPPGTQFVTKALYDAYSILAAVTDDTPVAVTVAQDTIVGRKTGGAIDDLSASEVRTILNVADGATANTKATGAELDTATDDTKFATAKALKDSHNVPSVVPSTVGNILTSDGTDWTSAAPAAPAVPTTITVADTADTSCYVGLFEDAAGNLAPKTDAGLAYNASTGVLTATGFSGPLTGNVTGNASGTAATVTGAAQANITSLGTLTGLTMGGSLNLGENGLVLDPAISADGYYSGITETGVAGATLAFGDLVYFNNDDSRWELVDANVSDGYDKKLGICVLAPVNDGDATTILLWGKINAATAFPDLTKGAPVYMSETAGDVVVAQPSTADVCIRVVGFGNTIDELYFCPSNDYVTHT